MIDERQEELASLYALDLLEGAERAQFETALARDPALQGLVREVREAAAGLAHAAPAVAPPPELKARVLQSIGAAAPAPAAGAKVIAFRFLPWAIAAGFAVIAGAFALRQPALEAELQLARHEARSARTDLELEQTKRQREQLLTSQLVSDLNRQLAGSNQQLATLAQRVAQQTEEIGWLKNQADLANLKIGALVSLNKNSAEAVAVAVWNPSRQEGVFAIEKAPALDATQTLELWVIEDKPGAAPVSAGVFTPNADGSLRGAFKTQAPVGALAKFAVSREKKDGARYHAAPSSDVLMLGDPR